MKKYLIFDLDGTLINSTHQIELVIENYILEKYPEYIESIKYYIQIHQGMALEEILEKVFKDKEKAVISTKEIYNLLNNLRNKLYFIEGIQEKILELSKKYKLFLTTGSSTVFAIGTLKDGGIYNCFELIYGSDEILKGIKHLEIFKEYSLDKDFYKNSVYIGDGEMDKIFANQAGIDFIRVGNKGANDEYRIKSVKYIDNFLK